MIRSTVAIALVVILAAAAAAQQPATTFATFVVNQQTGPNTTGAPWPRLVSIPLNQQFPIQISGAPSVPFVAFTGTYSPGYKTNIWGDILDINININNPNPSQIWANGLVSPTWMTDPSGTFQIYGMGTAPPLSAGQTLAGQVAIMDPSAAALWSLTNAIRITWAASQSQNITLTLTDDDFQTVTFLPSFSFPYYGTTRTNAIINANGFMSWNSGSSDFSPTASAFLTGMPRIAPLWTDLTPSCGGGSITWAETPQQGVMTFTNIQGFGCGSAGGGSYNFTLTLLPTGDFVINWSFNNGAPAFPHLSGFTKGGNAYGSSLNISCVLLPGQVCSTTPAPPSPYTTAVNGTQTQAFFEYWNAPPAPGFDLAGLTLNATPVNANQYTVY